eukprot:6988221-Alexandrium_andersonii.AAC.1
MKTKEEYQKRFPGPMLTNSVIPPAGIRRKSRSLENAPRGRVAAGFRESRAQEGGDPREGQKVAAGY